MDDDWIEVSRSETVLFIQYRFFLCKIHKLLRYINMIVLTTDYEQTFAIIPTRQSDEDNNIILLEFVNETTKEINHFSENIKYRDKDTLIIGADDFTFFKENTFYSLKIYFENTNEIIYKDRIFCTNQSKETFTINDGEYILPTINNNTYITI